MLRFLRHHPEFWMAAFVLVLVGALALVRSGGFAVTVGAESAPAASQPADTAHDDAVDARAWLLPGLELWDARCYSCHDSLAYIPELFLADGGRAYLIDLLLYGIRGDVVIEGSMTNLRHRSYAALDDEELAALLNTMLVAWGNDAALPAGVRFYQADEVAAARAIERTQDEVRESRPNPWE